VNKTLEDIIWSPN